MKYRQFDIEPEALTVLLIGKDGGVKTRIKGTADLGSIFALIDSMPMRREEMRAKKKAKP